MEHITRDQFDEYIKELEEPESFVKHRLNSFLKISNVTMPIFKHGLNIFIKPEFDFLSVKPKSKVNNKITIKYDEKSDVKIYSGNQFPDTDEVNQFLSDEWITEPDQLSYFHQAFTNDIILINIPKNVKVTEPIHINFDIIDSPTITSIFILGNENSSGRILITKSGGDYVSENVRILTKPGSKIDFVTIQNLNKQAINIQHRKAILGRDSEVKWVDVCLGTRYTKNNIISRLAEEGATTTNTVLYLASGTQKFDVYTASIHAAPNTNSEIITKGVLNNEAKAVSRGLVRIEENAPGSNGYETQDALLLSEKAEADAIPNLEIHNHDVKCSHGSTVGQVDSEKLFYLMSRGLNEDIAKRKIVEGYFTPVLALFNDELKQRVHESIIKSLEVK